MKINKNVKKGFTITEVLISIFFVLLGFFIMMTVFNLSMLHSTQSRHAIIARVVADSLIEEINAHSYGEPSPASWTEPHYILSVFQGRKVNIKFEKQIDYDNGSFIGQSSQDTDELLITIKWDEGTGVEGKSVTKSYREKLRVRRSNLE